jgi:hypothetical protein
MMAEYPVKIPFSATICKKRLLRPKPPSSDMGGGMFQNSLIVRKNTSTNTTTKKAMSRMSDILSPVTPIG